ncbi:MAG: TonB-dependent receptor [Balneolaceae bacterium]
MYKTITFLFLLILSAAQLNAQTVEGIVQDSATGDPLNGATVLQKDTQNGTVTDHSGNFRLQLLPRAEQQLIIRYLGYAQKTISIDGDSEISILLEPSLFRGNEIFVEDVRVDETAPVTQSTIERVKIEQDNIGQDPIYTLEKLTPSILTHSDSGTRFANYGYMRLRGMDQTRINMTLNGIPLNDMIDQGVFFSNFNDFGNSVQSVQVQRGVGTSTHGTASYAGSINFESLNINMDDASAGVKLTGGAFNSYRISSEVNTGSINNFGLYSRFSKTGSDGYRFNSGTESTSFFLSGGYFGSRDIFKVTAFSGQTQNELAYTPVPIDQIREEPRSNNISGHDEDLFGQQFLQMQYGRSFSNQLSMTTSLYYGGAGGDFPVGFSDENGAFVQQIFGIENDHYGLQSAIQYKGGNHLNLSAGLHIYRFDRINSESFAPETDNLIYQDDSYKEEVSTFIKASFQTGDFELYGDLQLRSVWLALNPDTDFLSGQDVQPSEVNVPVRQWTFLSPKIGAAYFLNDHFNVYGSFGRSGREPTRHDILGSTNINAANLAVVSDRNSVKAEYVNDYEAGLRFQSPSFTASLNGFFMQFKNEISPTGDFIPEGFIQLRENIEESNRSGIEAQWQWLPVQKVTFSGNATWMKTNIREFSPGGSDEIFTDVESILSPDWLANGTITYSPHNRLDLSFTGRYMGEAFLELTNRDDMILPSFFAADLGADVILRNNITASMKIHNLFDELYFTNGAPVDTTFDGIMDTPGYIVQPPRHLFLELQVQF